LNRIRRIQEDTGASPPSSLDVRRENTSARQKSPGSHRGRLLKTLAVSRLYLDNIDHIQSSWLTPGIKVCQIGLQFGADDVGSILIEENVVFAAGVKKSHQTKVELRRIISDAGFIPAGGEDYIFFDQDAADVIGAELQSDLADFDSGVSQLD